MAARSVHPYLVPAGRHPPLGSRLAHTLVLLLLAQLVSACAPRALRIPGPLAQMGRTPAAFSPPQDSERPDRPPSKPRGREEDALVEAARYYLDHPMRGFRDDCSGYIMAVYARAGRPIDGNTASMYAQAKEAGTLHRRREPKPGDIAFFDDTYDRNKNGALDDELSHIAVVLEVNADGTVLLAHGGTSRGRTTMQMNLRYPELRSDEQGQVYNDWLRVKRDSDPAGTPYLSGELWKAFSTPDFAPRSDSVASADRD